MGKSKEIATGLLRFVILMTLLYFFICSLTFLTDSFRLIAGRAAGQIRYVTLNSPPIYDEYQTKSARVL